MKGMRASNLGRGLATALVAAVLAGCGDGGGGTVDVKFPDAGKLPPPPVQKEPKGPAGAAGVTSKGDPSEYSRSLNK